MSERVVVGVKAKCGGCHQWLYAKDAADMKSVHESHIKVCPTITALEKIAAMGKDGQKLWEFMGAGMREDNLRKYLRRNHLTTDEARELLDAIDVTKAWSKSPPQRRRDVRR